MRKICLSFVLSVVSVFSISAQTNLKSTADTDAKIAPISAVKIVPVSPKTENGPVEPVDNPSPTNLPEEKKPAGDAPVDKTETAETVKKTVETGVSVKVTENIEPAKKTAGDAPVKATVVTETVDKTVVAETVKKPEQSILATRKSLGTLSTGSAAVDGYIEEFSALYEIDPLLIYAQMSQESSFKARATSSKGASGFMQLMPDTARRFGVTNIYNPKQNIKAGVKYMRWLLDKFGGDTRLALAGYNAGEGSVMKYGNKIPPYRETQSYVTKIMNHYQRITGQSRALAQTDEPAGR